MNIKALPLLSGLILFGSASNAFADVINIGLLNDRDTPAYQAFWRETAQTLSTQIPGHTFVITPLGLECLTHAVSKQQVQFAITNPAHTVLLEKNERGVTLATLQSQYGKRILTHYSAAIIASADRQDIQSLGDLKGQHVLASSPYRFGGYQMVWRQLLEAGIEPQADFFELFFSNDTDANIVTSVVEGKADAGVIQSGVLEQLLAQGKLQSGQLKVLNSTDLQSDLPAHSTPFYPEWSFVGLSQTDSELTQQVSRILLSLPKQNKGTSPIPAYGWTHPQDTTTVHGLLRALKLPPYAPFERQSLKEFLLEHRLGVGFILALMLLLLLFNARMGQVNRKLALSQSELANHRDNLEKQVQQRTQELHTLNSVLEQDILARQKVENTLRRSQSVLQDFYQILIRPGLEYEQKLYHLMLLAKNHFQMDAVFLYQVSGQPDSEEAPSLSLTAQNGDPAWQEEIAQCLVENYLTAAIQDFQSYQNNVCNKRMLILQIHIHDELHSLLVFAGNIGSEHPLEEVDKKLLRLITQWIRSSIEMHEIEEDREKYRLQLGKVARLYTMGEMASGLAHEINQPLTAATNYVGGSLRRLKEDNHIAAVENGLQNALLCLNQTTAIIRRLREFVQTGVPREEEFDFSPLIQRVLDLLASEARQRQIDLSYPNSHREFWVKGDKVQLEQVMLNLVRNAIEACDPHGRVQIEMHAHDDCVEISVIDSGTGIAPDEITRIFDPFHSSKPFGMGLGLAICRSIVEAHSSLLTVQNLNPGTAFSFKLSSIPRPSPQTLDATERS